MEGNGHNPTVKGPVSTTTLTLVITFDQITGQVGVQGPIQNALICYGILESAKDAIRKFTQDQAQEKRIQSVSVMPRLA